MFDRIASHIEDQLSARRIPGAAVALVRDGHLAWSRGFGVANIEAGEPMTSQTPFAIQSLTKLFIATAVMQLEEKRLLSVDEPIARYLPGVVQNQWESKQPILVRHLLTHTSGLPVDTTGGLAGDPRPLDDFVRAVAKTVRPPGSETVYANWGYDTAGLLIESVSGKPWYQYISEQICRPLGMRSTSIYPPDGAAYGNFLSAVDGEMHKLGRAQWPVTPSEPAGGLVSTVEDLALFAAAHLSGGRQILRADTAALMHSLSAAEPSSDGGMALGFRVTRSNGRRLLCHGGDGSGFTNFLGLYPDEGVAVVLSLTRAGAWGARSIIANTLLAMLAGGETPQEAVLTPKEPGAPTPGLYTSNFWDIELAVETTGKGLAARPLSGLPLSDGPEPSILLPVGGGAFAAEGGMFHGFEVTLGQDASLYGGLYPFKFGRTGDLPPAVEPLDEDAEITGTWRGSCKTPMGPLLVTLHVSGVQEARIETPFAAQALAGCQAKDGRVSGSFAMSVPGAGDLQLFLRLEARGGKLTGPIYARGQFGETPLAAELERA